MSAAPPGRSLGGAAHIGDMNTFDPSLHPRETTGKFEERHHQTPDLKLQAPGRTVVLEPGEQESFAELAESPIQDITVHRYEDGTYTVHPSMDLNIKEVLSPEFLRTSEAGAAAFIDRNWVLIQDCIKARYGAEVTSSPDEDGVLSVEFTAAVADAALTERDISAAAWNDTKITALANESDHGTFGSENLGRIITDRAAACTSVGNRMKAYGQARRMTDDQIDFEIAAKLGKSELNDGTAMAVAGRLAEKFGRSRCPVIHKLSYSGYADTVELGKELHALYAEDSYGRTGDRINMMFTWALRGGEVEAKAA